MDMEKVFTQLKEIMEKALSASSESEGKGDEEPAGDGKGDEVTLETLTKSIEAIVTRLDAVEKPAEKPEGDDPPESKSDDAPLDVESLTKAILEGMKPVTETIDAHGQVLEKALNRIEKLEGRTAVQKSASSDEVVSEGDDKPEPKAALFKSVQAAIRAEKKIVLT